MKKGIAVLLALGLTLGVSVTAFAQGSSTITSTEEGKNSQEIDVTAKYSAVKEGVVYSVDLVWDDMTFTYKEEGERIWNPADHTYGDTVTGGWDKTTALVKATNHSNTGVNVTFTYTPTETATGISGSIIDDGGTDSTMTRLSNTERIAQLDAGEENYYGGAAYRIAGLAISGTPNQNVTAEGIQIGTITVTIAGAEGTTDAGNNGTGTVTGGSVEGE